jgi:hypothetical protein
MSVIRKISIQEIMDILKEPEGTAPDGTVRPSQFEDVLCENEKPDRKLPRYVISFSFKGIQCRIYSLHPWNDEYEILPEDYDKAGSLTMEAVISPSIPTDVFAINALNASFLYARAHIGLGNNVYIRYCISLTPGVTKEFIMTSFWNWGSDLKEYLSFMEKLGSHGESFMAHISEEKGLPK